MMPGPCFQNPQDFDKGNLTKEFETLGFEKQSGESIMDVNIL